MSDFRFGLEEEYFVVDRRSAALRCSLPQEFMRAAKKKLGPSLMHELLQSQIEVATDPFTSPADARSQLRYFRRSLKDIGETCNVGIVAAGSHPLVRPHEQQVTRKRRYAQIIDDLGMIGLANPLCGLHVHVEIPEPDKRVDLMYRLTPFLPLLLALSTSSPFWAGCETGLLSYRNAANAMLPRSGFPEMFASLPEYQSYVDALVETGIIPDSTYIWWALGRRSSTRRWSCGSAIHVPRSRTRWRSLACTERSCGICSANRMSMRGGTRSAAPSPRRTAGALSVTEWTVRSSMRRRARRCP
jgi:glutamate---cysteine ligase / carboxylate-amine ligase